MPLLKYLADTNTVSEKMAGNKPPWLQAHASEVAINALSLAEVRRGIEIKPDSKARRDLEREFGYLMQDFDGAVWVFDEAAAMEWGRIMGEAHAKHHPLPYADSLIGAIARCMGAKVVTSDKAGFVMCDRIDPWTGSEHPAW